MSAAFRVGEPVRVRADAHPGHHRVPRYLKGRQGVVVRFLHEDRNPETLAYGKDGLPRRPVYSVRFSQRDLWPDYPGPVQDTVTADIFEHWLERSGHP
jgi:nitrile hydratase